VESSLVRVLGSDGRTELTPERYPSLREIVPMIAKSGPSAAGNTGTGVTIVNGGGEAVSTLKTFSPANRVNVTTTLDPELQTVAERAVRSHADSAAVALDYRNGHIRAVAFDGPSGNTAFLGSAAPGSTMKMVTAAAVIDKLGLTPSSPAPCIPSVTAGGAVFHNDDNETAPGANLMHAFAISCNTSFIGVGYKMKPGDLHDEARNVFGIGTDWSIGGGVFVKDGAVPATPPDPATQAADLIGQGQVTMNPLAIGSIAATIADGHYHQPVILPDQHQVPAAREITPETAASVRTLMRAAAQPGGTAGERMSGINGGAKTGTSEVGLHADSTNGWFAAFDKDNGLAVGALVIGGKTGANSAGFVAREILLGH
jgi:cell division protein FtsI/penicillin-binding protein 2